MLTSRSAQAARTTAGRPQGALQVAPRASDNSKRGGGAVCRAVEFSDAFRAALSTAIEREQSSGGGLSTYANGNSGSSASSGYERSSSYDNGNGSSSNGGGGRFANYINKSSSSSAAAYSSSASSDHGYSRTATHERPPTFEGRERYVPPPRQEGNSAGPLMQILATALGQSRATLERLQGEESEIENLIQQERKQVERLEWLLQKVQGDYSYFDSLQKRFEQHGRF